MGPWWDRPTSGPLSINGMTGQGVWTVWTVWTRFEGTWVVSRAVGLWRQGFQGPGWWLVGGSLVVLVACVHYGVSFLE